MASAQTWRTITPLPHCPTLTLDYQQSNGYFYVRYRPSPQDLLYTLVDRPLSDINDLSSLTDDLIEAAYEYCPLEMNIDEIERFCSEENETSPFDQNYIDFLRQFVIHVDQSGNNCSDVIPYMELQNTVRALREEELIQFDRSRNILNIFTGNESDLLMDHIRECGGSLAGTRQFLQNMILLEVRNACMTPKPPGLLDFEKAKEIAADIASRYPAMGVLGINSRRHEITRDTIQSFVGPILEDQVTAIAGEGINIEALKQRLPSVQGLSQVSDKRLMDYTNHVMGPDLVLEVVDEILPTMIENNFEPMLGTLSASERQSFLQNELTNPIRESYRTCIAPMKQRIRFHDDSISPKNMILYRQSIRDQYCQRNPQSCEQVGCDSQVNYFSLREDINDMSLIQSCIYQAINQELESVVELQLSQQLQAQVSLPGEASEIQAALAPRASEILQACFERKSFEITQKPYSQLHTNGHPESLLFLDPNSYQQSLLECAKEVERSMTLEIGSLLVAGEPAFSALFSEQDLTQINGASLNPEAFQTARNLVENTLNRCYEAQLSMADITQTNSSLCIPLITMKAGQTVISSEINRMLESFNISQNAIDRVTFDYQICAHDVINESLENILNPQGSAPLMTNEDALNYINQTPEYLECTKSSILDSVDEVSIAAFEDVIAQQGHAIDQTYALSLSREVQSQVRQCYETGLAQIDDWNDFLEFNSERGLDQLQANCTTIAEEYALPRLIENEIDRQLVMLRQTNTLSLTTEEIIGRIANQDNNTGNSYQLLLSVFRDFRTANPEATIDDFVASFTGEAQYQTINAIYEHIVEEVLDRTQIGFPMYQDITEILTPECLNDFYNIHKDDLTNMINTLNASSTPQADVLDLREVFVTIITDGLYQSLATSEYTGLLSQVELMCSNPQNFNTLESLIGSEVADNFIAATIRSQLLQSFKLTAQNQCVEDLVKLGIRPIVYTSADSGLISQELADQFCSPEIIYDSEMSGIYNQIRDQLDDPRQINALDFIWNRKKKTIRMVNSTFTPDTIRALMIEDREILDYIYQNFVPVVGQNPEIMNELTGMVVSKIFEERSQDSFASEFIEMQLTSAIGIEGYPIAREQLETQISQMEGFIQGRGFVRERAQEIGPQIFNRYWRFASIEKNLNWEDMSQNQRENLMTAVIDLNIMPRYNLELTATQREEQNEELAQIVTSALENTRVTPNPDYRPSSPSRGPRNFNFNESISQELTHLITNEVESDVWSDIGSFFNPFD